MKTLFILLLSLSSFVVSTAQELTFEFTASNERMVTIGQAAPKEFAKPMKDPKLVSYKNGELTITTISTGKVYLKETVIRVVEFSKGYLLTYALEVKDSDGLYFYYVYNVNKSPSGDSKSLVIPYPVKGRSIMEETYLE